MNRWVWWLVLILLAPSVRANEPAEAPALDELVRRLLDSEALYTMAGPLKPLSDGFWQARFPATGTTSPAVERVRHHLATLPWGDDYAAGVYVFAQAFNGQRSATAFVAHRPLVRGVVWRYPEVFRPLGITLLTEPEEMLSRIDRAEAGVRWRAFGLLFGYPEAAVDFFVRAGLEEKQTGQFVPRDFRHVPTFGNERGRFVYAVPKGMLESDADRTLRASAAPILAEYTRRRAVYLAPEGPGAAALLRDWLSPPAWPLEVLVRPAVGRGRCWRCRVD